jgi:hypothetical protein
VQVIVASTFTLPLALRTPSADTLFVTPTLADGLYYWRVRAQKADSTWGAWSAVDSFVVDVP